MAKIKISIDTGFAGCTHIDDEFDTDAEIPGWDEMTQEEKDKAMEEPMQDMVGNYIDVWYEVI